MDDSQRNSSKSKKRRNRKRNRKVNGTNTQNVTETNDNSNQPSTSSKTEEISKKGFVKIVIEDYIVHSPKELSKDSKLANKPVKSRSLDDDEMVKIQELSDINGADDKDKGAQVIITEAASESEAELEKEPQTSAPAASEEDSSLRSYLQGLNLSATPEETPQETYERIAATPLLSVEEEESLRNFLQGLNLVTGPEEAAQNVYETSSNESIKQRKARKKAEIEQYFLPISQNPRFLEAISEEASDRDSDREQTDLKKHLKQGTPELDLPPKAPPRPNRDRRRSRFNQTEEQAVLVDARIVDTDNIQGICSTMQTEEAASGVEVVFLSSGTSTPEEHSTSSNSYVLGDENASSVEDVSTSTLEVQNNENENNENEVKDNEFREANDRIESKHDTSRETVSKMVNGTNTEKEGSNNIIVSSDAANPSSKPENIISDNKTVDADLLTQLTPPPTPEDVSPKSEKTAETTNTKSTRQDDHFIHVYNNASKEDMYKRFIDNHQIKKKEECSLRTYVKSTESTVNVCKKTEQTFKCEKKNILKEESREDMLNTMTGIKKAIVEENDIDRRFGLAKVEDGNKNAKELGSMNSTNTKMSSVDESRETEIPVNELVTEESVGINHDAFMQQTLDDSTPSPPPSKQDPLIETKTVTSSNVGIVKKSDSRTVEQNSKTTGELSSQNEKLITRGQHDRAENNIEEELVVEVKPVDKVGEHKENSTRTFMENKDTINVNKTSSSEADIILNITDVGSPLARPPMCKDAILHDTHNIRNESNIVKAEFIRRNVMSPPPRPPMYKCNTMNETDVIKQGGIMSLRSPVLIEDRSNDLMSPPPRPPMYEEIHPHQSRELISVTEMKKTGKTSLTPPPPPPRSSSSSSSRGSSLCTAKYNPTTSSASDIASLIAEETHQHCHQPLTLRELCLKCLLKLPFGADILQELAETSKSMVSYTDILSSKYFSKFASSEAMINKISSDISVRTHSQDMSGERTIPISKEWKESPYDRVRRFGRSLDSFAGLSKPSKEECVKSLTEIDILRETEDLQRCKNIHVERNIPISKDWSYTAVNQGDLDSKTDIPVFRDLIQGMRKTEVVKEMDGEVVVDTSIPPTKEDITEQQSKPAKTEYNIPITKAWEEKCSKLKEAIANSENQHLPAKEFTIPVEKEWRGAKKSVEGHGNKEVIIPVAKDWQNQQSSKEFHQSKLQKTSLNQIEKTKTIHTVSTGDKTKKQECRNPKEFIVPIMKEIGSDPTCAKSKEVIIPIIQETKQQKLSRVTGNSKGIDTNFKEVSIPIIQNGETSGQDHSAAKGKEVLISIVRESKDHQRRDVSASTEVQNSTQGSNKTREVNEFSIPITRESERKHKNTVGTKHVNFAPMAGDQKASKQVIIPIAQEKHKGKEVNVPISRDWVGLPSEKDPNHLLCLSPKQKEELEKCRKVPEEADKLLDLHEKYYQRTTSEELKKTPSHENVTITSIQPIPTTNRLLTIIREEPSTNTEDPEFLYFVEKDPRPQRAQHKSLEVLNTETSRPHNTLPRINSADNARLRAKNLNEWLNLARNKSMSESNLSTAFDVPENNLRNMCNPPQAPHRRTSLPNERLERQMIHLQEKEREIQKQLEELEEERRRLNAEMAPSKEFHPEDYRYSRKGDFAESKQMPTSTPAMPTEFFRQQMYEEFLDKFAERQERRQQKVIKVSSAKDESKEDKPKEVIHPVQIEDEFMEKVHQKQEQGKLEKIRSLDKESSAEKEKDEAEPKLIIDGKEVKRKKKLPKHLQEFVDITKQTSTSSDGVWSPGQHEEYKESPKEYQPSTRSHQDDSSGLPPVWTPKSATSSPTVERKEFKPVNFQSPVLGRKHRTQSESLGPESPSSELPWKVPDYSSDSGFPASRFDKRLPTSHSSPASGFNELSTPTPRLPKAQNPTITLLQKAREGHLPRGPNYIEVESKPFRPRNDRPPIASPGEVLYQIKHEYTSDSETDRPRKMADLGPRKFEGVGPVTKDGMPVILRSEVKDQNQSKWYKKMYDTIHKQRPRHDEYVTVRYKQRRAQYPYSSGYLSEPEPGAYDSDFTDYKYQTLDRRKPMTERIDYSTSTMPRSMPNRSSSSDILRNSHEQYKNQPGRIENYTPGHSSISEKEAKEHLEQQKRVPTHHQQPHGFMSQAFKESGYESDSTLVFRRREEAQQLNPREQREAYKTIQKGGDVPLYGLRKPAPERPKEPEPPLPPPKGLRIDSMEAESPRKYVENEVTIHYRTPVRQEVKGYLSEDELAQRHANTARRVYDEERRKKYLQVSKSLHELQDMNSRRHTDNFTPSQKSPISLNRYDDFDDLAVPAKPRPRSPEPRLVAKALYNFVGQTARELTFRKGDLIYVRRQVDKNWYEGELNAMVGLFPVNYVEVRK
ncbi:unnamed protein product [Acanthoscelides obtectus]|uniref:SoHo domain-containing protein n=1 Tax=Acanthoscelides obtectus TaxID=200917 RepID=A0A9P0L8P8_ACAOB|nr:unnamed protein product [Acanthoscelides obtectus]CAK1630850.1 Sorbin and SH3 domain-containing protein 1 [Acanthoscelides obtectus]